MLRWLGLGRGASQAELDRRVGERHPLSPDSACRIIVTMGLGSFPADIIDLASGGIGFLFPQPVELDSLVIVLLTNSARAFSKLVPLRVAHCAEQEDGSHFIGGEFAR